MMEKYMSSNMSRKIKIKLHKSLYRNFRHIASLVLIIAFSTGVGAFANVNESGRDTNKDWLKIYYQSNGLPSVSTHPIVEIDSVYYTSEENTESYSGNMMKLNVAAQYADLFSVPVDSIDSIILGGNIPSVYIDTEPYVDEITSRSNYLPAKFRYVPYGDGTKMVETEVSIRGRGNSSWAFPKKPYRLKFDKKQSLGNLNKAKSFVLISNYIDFTLMKNAVAFKIADLLGMPYTNIPLPVNLVFNGKQRGSYMMTNKVGINSGSVDIDENEGILWELDTNFDEEFQFISPNTGMPCMVKDPDFHEISEDNMDKIAELWSFWYNDLENAFSEVKKGNWKDVFDPEQFVKFFLVNNIVQNGELGHPKSMFMYKENREQTYKLGPVWDFDWALGYNFKIDYTVFNTSTLIYKAFSPIFKDKDFRALFKETLDDFCENKLDDLLVFIDDYATLIRDSALQDATIWPEVKYHPTLPQDRTTAKFDSNVAEIKEWLLKRIEIIKQHPNFSLY